MPGHSEHLRFGKMDATLTTRTGEVLEIDTDIRAHVNSHYNALTETEVIRTTHSKTQTVFVKRDDGEEEQLILQSANLPIRKGTRLGYIELDAGSAKERLRTVAATANLDSGKTFLNCGKPLSLFLRWRDHAVLNIGVFVILSILLAIFTDAGIFTYAAVLATQLAGYAFTGFRAINNTYDLANAVHKNASEMIEGLVRRQRASS